MKKILIYLCGEGFGHTTRCISIAKTLENQYDVLFAAYGKSKEFIEKSGFNVVETHREITLKGEDGKLKLTSSVPTVLSIKEAIKRDYEILKNYDPDLVISDTKYSAIIASKIRKKPIIFVNNQNYTRYKIKTDIIIYPAMTTLNILVGRCDVFVVPDYPPPYTICEYNMKLMDNMEFIGPLVRFENNKNCKEDYILSIIGGFEYRYKILKTLGEIALKTDLNVKLVCGSEEVAKKLKSDLKLKKFKEKNIEIIPLSTDMEKLMKNAKIIVSHGGHSTIMEALYLGKPLIVVPDKDHPEQNNNAKKVDELGCGIFLDYEELEMLEVVLEEVLNNPSYKENAQKMKKLTQRYEGKKKIKEIIESLIN